MTTGKSNPLRDKIARLIKTGGPMPLADYMHLCLSDPEHGYYMTRPAIGAGAKDGDFITAPEVSQMFGELIGIWCVAAWQALDRPDHFTLAELGPGKGTLMSDLLRAAAQVPDFLKCADLRLVETSGKMADKQQDAIKAFEPKLRSVKHVGSVDDLPEQPLILVANEFLDAVPFRQFVKSGDSWQEVGVCLSEDGTLQHGMLANKPDIRLFPKGADDEPDGAVFELAPAREAVVETLSNHIAQHGGAALLIDYGHMKSGFGDTFQAVADHEYADPFAAPGKADMTSHVDFERLNQNVQAIDGLASATTTQGRFLLALGLLERAGALGHNKAPQEQDTIRNQVERLAAPDQMGELFKVMAIFPETLRLPGFDHL